MYNKQYVQSWQVGQKFFPSAEVAEDVQSLSTKGKDEVHLAPPPTRKERLADQVIRWAWFLYLEIICYMLEIDKINIFVKMNI